MIVKNVTAYQCNNTYDHLKIHRRIPPKPCTLYQLHIKRRNLPTYGVKLIERNDIYALGYRPINLTFQQIKLERKKILYVKIY